jgi:hypothetical protein
MKKSLLCYNLLLLVVFSFSLNSQTKVIPYHELPTASGNPTGSGMFLGATMTTSSITITFTGPSDRWIAIGFGNFMTSTDAFIYSQGHSLSVHPLGWYDYYISSYFNSGVLVDATQNWTVTSTGTVSPGQRTVTASRVLNTGDVNDVAFNFTTTALNVVWARGATADYTIAYHGSSNRASSISMPWLSTPTASFTTSATTLCTGSSLTYSNLSQGGQTTYTWTFDGGSPATSTSTNPVVSYATPGTYSVVLTASNAIGTSTYTQINYVTINPTVTPAVSIGITNGSNPLCNGSTITFTASNNNGGASPTYQWKVNGVNAGTNSNTFTTSTLSNSSQVTCVMVSNAVCPVPSSVTSAAMVMTVSSTAPASISIALSSGNNPLCNGAMITFSANPFNGGSSPSYQWKINGVNVGTNSFTFVTNTLVNGDVVTCELNSSSSCASSTFATSPGITMSVSSVLVPSVSIAINSGSNPLCSGHLITFSANPTNGGGSPSYQWKVNGVNSGSNSATFTSSTLTNGAVINCVMTSGLACSSPATATSAVITMSINPTPPAPTITPNGTISSCSASPVTLSSSASSGNIWSNGASTQTILVTTTGSYAVTQVLNGCSSLQSSTVNATVYPSATASLSNIGPFCDNSDPVLLQGSPVGGNYAGPGVAGTVFNPGLANIGTHLIIYTYYLHPACPDTASIMVNVMDCQGIGTNSNVKSLVTVYPNPGKDLFKINSYPEKMHVIRVLDLSGKKIIERHVLENESSVDLSQFPSGLYLMEITLDSRTVHLHVGKEN